MLEFKAHSKPIYSLAFSPDGGSLLSSGGDELVRLWSLNPVEKKREWPGSQFWGPVAFAPSGEYVGRGGYGIAVWPVDVPEPVISSTNFTESVAFSPDSSVFVAHGASDHSLSRWSLPEGSSLGGGWGGTRRSNSGNQFPTGPIAFHPEGIILAACFGVLGDRGFDSVIYLWNAESGVEIAALRATYASAHPTGMAFSPDGERLAAVYGPWIRVWEIASHKELAQFKTGKKHFKGLTFTPGGSRLVSVSNDAIVRSWDTTTWNEAGSFEWKIGKLGAIAAAPDGDRLAVGGSNGKIIVWDVDR